MDSSTELHLSGSWNSLCPISHQWDDLYWYQFKCEQGDSDSYSRMGDRENEIVEGSILMMEGQIKIWPLFIVRSAGRTHLEVKVLYGP